MTSTDQLSVDIAGLRNVDSFARDLFKEEMEHHGRILLNAASRYERERNHTSSAAIQYSTGDIEEAARELKRSPKKQKSKGEWTVFVAQGVLPLIMGFSSAFLPTPGLSTFIFALSAAGTLSLYISIEVVSRRP